jgi:ParB-like chromosome segregation protein Spo0J
MPRSAAPRVVAEKAAQLEQLTVEYLPLEAIHPNDYNPNRQSERDFQLLCRSIEEDGFTQPVIIAEDGTIVDGEHRWRAAAALLMKQIPCVRLPMSAERARIATLRHNRARGTEDLELGVAVLRDLERLGALAWAASSLMIDDDALNQLLEDVPAPEALAAEDYSQAWEPAQAERYQPRSDAKLHVDTTPAAMTSIEQAEERRRAAPTADGRQASVTEGLYSITIVFLEDEASVVREALGAEPARALLRLCQAEDFHERGNHA